MDNGKTQNELINGFITRVEIYSSSISKLTQKEYRTILVNIWLKRISAFLHEKKKLNPEDTFKLEPMKIHEIDKERLYDILSKMIKDNKFKPTTIRKYFSVLSAYFEYLIDIKLIDKNIVKEVRLPKKETRRFCYLNVDEQRFVLSGLIALDKRKKTYYQDIFINYLPIILGLRISEVSALNINSFNFTEGFVKVIGKGNKERIIFFPKSNALFTKLFDSLIEERNCRIADFKKRERIFDIDSLFLDGFGKRMTIRTIQRRFNYLMNLIHFSKDNFTYHSYRHTFGTMMVRVISLLELKELMGHESISTTEIYAHVSLSEIDKKLANKSPFDFPDISVN